ncbi:glutamate ABC transporter substrate-binding protein [Mycobacterium koreense]|uniref:ABC transporter substrate-binding protein n=1 Tax=Mycolicibacillus koreensis TaxID=1069220 RepID=A0A7I7SEP2_9MYCO|nr:glutamate ABC transporter substrate-binding protein [Mycolicibacillus koreensis]MCV7248447.1 glutamate ABC transporter substrate-binding protein [Mycolicibacillus koreensis]OSC26946.1 ABC transporter substrate-binding protein [Mycolicibacillus koreensis]BBY55392.1 ABC transporter substrate-binding protein [Mycolicibacillus koreensis]
MTVVRARLAATLAALVVVAGCGHTDRAPSPSTPTLPPPTPAGMQELAPQPPLPPPEKPDCKDPTASLRPFSNKADAAAAVKTIRDRGRLIVGLDIGSNLLSFRDPITGEITGFDVDIAGEVARDIFGSPLQVEYRILSSAERVTALEKKKVDIVVKSMSITCERRKLVNFSTVYLTAHQRILIPRDSSIAQAEDLSGKRVCVARGTTSLNRIRRIAPPPIIVSVVTWADCLVAIQQRQVDAVSTDDSILAGLVSQDPYLNIVGPYMGEEPYGIGINKDDPGLVRFVNGTLERIRRDGTWNTLYRRWLSVLGPAPPPPAAKYEAD